MSKASSRLLAMGTALCCLVLVAGAAALGGSAPIEIDPVTRQNMGLRVAPVTRGVVHRTVRAYGSFEADETTEAEVASRTMGWVESVRVNATGTEVKPGDVLLEYYSPDIYAAESEFVLALESADTTDTAHSMVVQASRRKLELLGLEDDQILGVEMLRAAVRLTELRARHAGTVVEKMVVPGMAMEPGMKLYRTVDYTRLWLIANVYESDLGSVSVGQKAAATVVSDPGRQYDGEVGFVQPEMDAMSRTARVRLVFDNHDGSLRAGMSADVHIHFAGARDVILVPETAVLRSGEECTAFVALDGGRFEPRALQLGAESEGGMVEVLSGLSEGERVVVSGQFLLDSESRMRESIQKMLAPGGRAPSASDIETKTFYHCPMSEHPAVYDKPGNCPLCGMKLVPIPKEQLRALGSQPSAGGS